MQVLRDVRGDVWVHVSARLLQRRRRPERYRLGTVITWSPRDPRGLFGAASAMRSYARTSCNVLMLGVLTLSLEATWNFQVVRRFTCMNWNEFVLCQGVPLYRQNRQLIGESSLIDDFDRR